MVRLGRPCIISNFSKAVFQKSYSIHSWILWFKHDSVGCLHSKFQGRYERPENISQKIKSQFLEINLFQSEKKVLWKF